MLFERIPFIFFDLLLIKYYFWHYKNMKVTIKCCFQVPLNASNVGIDRHVCKNHGQRKHHTLCLCVKGKVCYDMKISTTTRACHGTHMPTTNKAHMSHTFITPIGITMSKHLICVRFFVDMFRKILSIILECFIILQIKEVFLCRNLQKITKIEN